MKGKYTPESAAELLRQKNSQKGSLPTKSDFTAEEVCAIKAFLGPWPRALEAAGLKQPVPKKDDTLKRIRQKRTRTDAKKASSEDLSE